ncbi:MAG: hypothetical protein ACI4WM_02135 [Erysipelotrichaceae bacterium]
MVKSASDLNESQKECAATAILADAVEILAEREHISCEEALLRFASTVVYNALYDYETGIWKESGEYLISLYDRYGK